MVKKRELKDGIRTNTITHREDIEKEKETLKNNFDEKKRQLEARLRSIIKK